MSDSPGATARSAPVSVHNSAQGGAADLRMLVEVEKWMAMIREINREQPAFHA